MESENIYTVALEIRMLTAILTKTARRALEQRLNASDTGISGLQYGIMHALSHEQQTISELSQKFLLDPSTLVPAVDALERKGLAKRGRDPNDRRRVPLSLTERGADFVTCVPWVDENNPLVQSLASIGAEARQQLLLLLRELVMHLPEGETILQHVASRVRLHVEHEPKRC